MQGDKPHPQLKVVCEDFMAKGLTQIRKADKEGELQAGKSSQSAHIRARSCCEHLPFIQDISVF